MHLVNPSSRKSEMLDLNAAQRNLDALVRRMGATKECPSSQPGFCPERSDLIPLKTDNPQLLRTSITASSKYPDASNTITVRVVANVPVFELILCGLIGSQTPGLGTDIAFDEIAIATVTSGAPGEKSFTRDVFGRLGFWTQRTGTLVLRQLPTASSPPGKTESEKSFAK